MGHWLGRYCAATVVVALAGVGTAGAVEEPAAMAEQLDRQQREIERLRREQQELTEQLEATVEWLEQSERESTDGGHGAAGAETSVGGYGELHYNNLDSKEEIDLHRLVLFVGHRFTDDIRLVTEIEFEHGFVADNTTGSAAPGEVAVEQAYLDFTLNDHNGARAGVILVPVGILNETHEPPTFYGVERNPVETNIIPTTWREAGAGLYGEIWPGLRYDFLLSSGLEVPTSGADAYLIRSGRQDAGEATASDPAITARLRWLARPGIDLGISVQHQADVTQGAPGPGVESSAELIEAHMTAQRGSFELRVLAAAWDLDGSAAAAVGRDEQQGWYVEPAWRVRPNVGLFARYHEWDNEAGSVADTKKKQAQYGINYWPHEHVVIKFDYQDQSGNANDDGFNIGVGFHF